MGFNREKELETVLRVKGGKKSDSKIETEQEYVDYRLKGIGGA